MEIGQYLATMWTKVCSLLFGGHPVEKNAIFADVTACDVT